jgi:hypothetical protein
MLAMTTKKAPRVTNVKHVELVVCEHDGQVAVGRVEGTGNPGGSRAYITWCPRESNRRNLQMSRATVRFLSRRTKSARRAGKLDYASTSITPVLRKQGEVPMTSRAPRGPSAKFTTAPTAPATTRPSRNPVFKHV